MDVPLPLDKLALELISNEPSPGNTSKYVYLLLLVCVREISIELILNYDTFFLQWQNICNTGGNWKL